MKSGFLVVILLIKINLFSQIYGGGGLNIGYKNVGFELQGYALSRLKVFSGIKINRFDSFSFRLGTGVGVLKLEKKHNFWVNSSLEYKFANTTVIERNDILYSYYTNKLNYWNFGGNYSFRIDSNIEKDNFFLLEFELFYSHLLNTVEVNPLNTNTSVSLKIESNMRRFFYSGPGFSVGIKFIW